MGIVIGGNGRGDLVSPMLVNRHGSGAPRLAEAHQRQAWAQTSLWQEKALAKRA